MLACWDRFFSSLSRLANNCSTLNTATNISALTSASKLLSLTAVRGGKATMIEGGSETPPTPWLLQCLSLKWTLSSQQWLRTKTTQRKPSLPQDGEVGGRGDKQKGIWLDNLSAVTGECVVVLWCVRKWFSLHCTCSRGSVSVRHTALTDYSLSLKMRYSLASAVVLHCASASYFLPF